MLLAKTLLYKYDGHAKWFPPHHTPCALEAFRPDVPYTTAFCREGSRTSFPLSTRHRKWSSSFIPGFLWLDRDRTSISLVEWVNSAVQAAPMSRTTTFKTSTKQRTPDYFLIEKTKALERTLGLPSSAFCQACSLGKLIDSILHQCLIVQADSLSVSLWSLSISPIFWVAIART